MHRSILAITLLLVACVDDTEPSNAPLALTPGDSNSETSGGAIPSGQNPQDQSGDSNGASSSSGNTNDNTSSMSGGTVGNGGQSSNSGDLGQPCANDGDCAGGLCLNGLPNGYCSNVCTDSGDCEGGLCFGLRDLDDQVCLLSCESNLECRSNDGYICDSDNTCFPGGSNAASGGSDGNGTVSIGGACDEDNDCRDENAVCLPPGGASNNFVDGYCYLPGCGESRPCPEGSGCFQTGDSQTACLDTCENDSECRSGYRCDEPGVCLPGCTEGSCPEGLICSESGSCVLDVGTPPPGPVPDCSSVNGWRCTTGNCGDLLQLEPRVGLGYNDYALNGETLSVQYRSWARRDLLALVTHAADMVACLSAGWQFGDDGPLGLGDMSEENGEIPGTRDGSPGHPPGTHTNGTDMDIAYYMLDLPRSCQAYEGCENCHCLSPVCEHRVGGQTQYHCVGEPELLDVWRTALFIGYLHASPQLRVIGVDGKIGPLVHSAIDQLCDGGWLNNNACNNNRALSYETTDMGLGWFRFHHHHLHISITPTRGYSLPNAFRCLDPECLLMSLPEHDPRINLSYGHLEDALQSLP